jgi:hypothetical protein
LGYNRVRRTKYRTPKGRSDMLAERLFLASIVALFILLALVIQLTAH